MSDRTYHLAVRDNYQPRMLAQFTVSHLKRNQLGITLGVSDGTRQTPATVWSAGEITYQGVLKGIGKAKNSATAPYLASRLKE